MKSFVSYEFDGKTYEGAFVYDDDIKTPRPAILVQPDWNGVCDHTLDQAAEVAGTDYVAFVADMFGKGYGAKPKAFADLMATSSAIHNDLPFTLSAGNKAIDVMIAEGGTRGLVDPKRLATVGFCFGGGLSLELARTGLAFEAVTVFHVTYPKPVVPGTQCHIKGQVLTVHGAADPVTSKAMIGEFEDELTAAGVSWETVMFGGAVHSFTDPTAHTPGRNMYDPVLAQRSYARHHELMRERFA